MGFFTLRRSATIVRAQFPAEDEFVPVFKKEPTGLWSELDAKQKALDNTRAASAAFLRDIEAHFGPDAKFLRPEYHGRSRSENLDKKLSRKFGMRWAARRTTFDDYFFTNVIFAYTSDTEGKVRLDYILHATSGEKKVINDDFGRPQVTLLEPVQEAFLSSLGPVDRGGPI